MKNPTAFKLRQVAAAGAALLALLAAPAQAVNYTVVAEAVNAVMPDGVSVVPMWGYRVSAPGGDLANALTAPITSPGAALVVPPLESTLSVTLHNLLPGGAPTSFVVHGLNTAMTPVFVDAAGAACVPGAGATDAIRRACRMRSFTAEAVANGAPVTYNYNNVRPGTYLYQSGTQPQIQVQMGLYGMMSRNAADGVVYPGVAFANQSRVIFSEVDPAVHAAVAAGTFTGSTLDYNPKHFRTHVYDESTHLPLQVDAGSVPQYTGAATAQHLIRMANAGLQTRVPTLSDGTWALLGEDAQPYPYAREQYSALLPAAKTTEAWIGVTRSVAVFDRRMAFADSANGVAGQLVQFSTTLIPPASPAQLSAACPVIGTQGVAWRCTVSSTTTGATLALVSGPAGMTTTLTALGLQLDWTPSNAQAQRPANPTIVNPVVVSASATGSTMSIQTINVAVVNVNDAPTAVANTYTGAAGVRTFNIAAANGVLANDIDIDGDPLSASILTPPVDGTFALNADGSFSYALPPTTLIPAAGLTRSFVYRATDPSGASADASVTMTFAPPLAPVANPDSYAYIGSLNRNAQTFNVLLNDQQGTLAFNLTNIQVAREADGVGATTGQLNASTTRGMVQTPNSGNIAYTQPLNTNNNTTAFYGTDYFYYRVRDTAGVFSNWTRVDVAINARPVRTAQSTTFGSLDAPNLVTYVAPPGPSTTYATPDLTTTTYVVDVDGTVNPASMLISASSGSALGTVPVAAACFVPAGAPNTDRDGQTLTGFGTFSLSNGTIVFTPLRRSNYQLVAGTPNPTSLPIRCAAYYQVSDYLGAQMATRALVTVYVQAD